MTNQPDSKNSKTYNKTELKPNKITNQPKHQTQHPQTLEELNTTTKMKNQPITTNLQQHRPQEHRPQNIMTTTK